MLDRVVPERLRDSCGHRHCAAMLSFFFFFQAEDGIRDSSVTGVQTCALPILPRMAQSGRFDYFETPEMQAIRLPFGDGDLVMEVLLPAKSSSLGALETALKIGRASCRERV